MTSTEKATATAIAETAVEKLSSAAHLHELGHYNDALSRAYYAAFHAISLVFFLDGKSFSRHGQLIGAFNKDYIVTGIFPKELGKAMGKLYDARQSSDYDVFVKSSRMESERGLKDAGTLLEALFAFVNKKHSAGLPAIILPLSS